MRKILSTLMLLLTVAFLSKGQDVNPIDPINFKALQSPSFSFMIGGNPWIFKGSYFNPNPWTELAGWTKVKDTINYYVPYDSAWKDVNLGDKKITSTKQRLPLFNGACVVPTITDNGNGSITVSNGEYNLSTNTDGRGTETFLINGGTFALTDQSQNYLVADYNGGTPILKIVTDVNLINETTVIPIYTAYRNGIFLHYQNWDSLGLALANKVHQSIVKTQRYRREYGLIVTEYGTHNLNMTAGRVWVGAVPVDIAEINTGVDNLSIWYHSGGNWVNSIQPAYNFTQWDNGTNLVTLTNNRYAVNWIFRGIENQKHLYIVLGRGDYSLVEAEASSMPPVPTIISSHATLAARLIVEKNAATATNIKSAFEVQFSLASVQKHDDLTGRDVVNSHPASAISNTPAGSISSTNVQAAINELDTEKEPLLTKGLLTETVDGLELSSGGTRQVIGGSEAITLTAGRVIPTTTNISHAETAYTHSQSDTDLSPTNEANTSLTYNQTTRVLSVTDPVATRSATLPLATTIVDGLMSKEDKTKLNTIPLIYKNGIYKDSDTIKLGGVLTEDTDINVNDKYLSVYGNDKGLYINKNKSEIYVENDSTFISMGLDEKYAYINNDSYDSDIGNLGSRINLFRDTIFITSTRGISNNSQHHLIISNDKHEDFFYKNHGSEFEVKRGTVQDTTGIKYVNIPTAYFQDSTLVPKYYVDGLVGGTQTLSTNGGAGNISISSGNTITLNVNDHTNRTAIDNVSGVNTGDNATNTTSNSYADGKVQDTIVDGVTTIAPSQNAVYDSLVNKVSKVTSTDNAIVRFDGTGGNIQNSGAYLFDSGNFYIGNNTENSYSRMLVYGGTNGANLGVRGEAGTFTDQATLEVMGNDYDTAPRSALLQYMGSTHTGTTLGYSNSNLSQLVMNGDNNLIYSSLAKPIIFGTNNQRSGMIDIDGKLVLDSIASASSSIVTASTAGKLNKATFTTTGNSGAATFSLNNLNIPHYTLSGLGGQPQLNGTGFVKASGTTISYDNSTYEPAFSKNTAFNKNFGTTTGTVLEGRTFGTAANNNTGDFAPSSGSSNYIQASPAEPQSANIDITGTVKSSRLNTLVQGISNAVWMQGGSTPSYGWKFNLEEVTTGDLFLKRLLNDVDYDVIRFNRANGEAIFSSSINAPTYKLNSTPLLLDWLKSGSAPLTTQVLVGGGTTSAPTGVTGTEGQVLKIVLGVPQFANETTTASDVPILVTSNSNYLMFTDIYKNSRSSTNTDISIILSNLGDGKSGKIEVDYTGAAIVTFVVDETLTIHMNSDIYGSTSFAYRKSVLSKSSGVAKYEYYRSGNNVFIDGKQTYQ